MTVFVFEPFELDPGRRRLSRAGEPMALSDRQLDVLLLLVSRAGQIVPKDELLDAGWKDVAVGDNSVEQAISNLRKLLGAAPGGTPYIETHARRGYRFSGVVTRKTPRTSDEGLDALLAPHRAFLEGRAALETFDAEKVRRARQAFEQALGTEPEHASAHVGLASACLMQFETTRADPAPNVEALAGAAEHAREACRLDPDSSEAWATLGFVLGRTGHTQDAQAASKRAVALEPDNWRHHFRLAYLSWGEERLRAAHRTLVLLPGLPLAHWLAATVYVARQAFDLADRELAAAIGCAAGPHPDLRFSPVAIHWLRGLLLLAHGDAAAGRGELGAELAFEHSGHLYARESSANAWYAIGALHLRADDRDEAQVAFAAARRLVAEHPLATIGLAIASGASVSERTPSVARSVPTDPVDVALGRAVLASAAHRHSDAARIRSNVPRRKIFDRSD